MLRLRKNNPSSKSPIQAQTAIEYLLLLSVVVSIVLIAFNGNYLGRVHNAANIYFDRVAVGIYGNASTCGDGQCDEKTEDKGRCPTDCPLPPPPPPGSLDCDPVQYTSGNCGVDISLPRLDPGQIYGPRLCPPSCNGNYKVQCVDGKVRGAEFCVDATAPAPPCICDPNPGPACDQNGCTCDPDCGPPATACILDGKCDAASGETPENCGRDCGGDCNPPITITSGNCPTSISLTDPIKHNQSKALSCPSGCVNGGSSLFVSCYNGTISQQGVCNDENNIPPTSDCSSYIIDWGAGPGTCAGPVTFQPTTDGASTSTNCPTGCTGQISAECHSGRFSNFIETEPCTPIAPQGCVGGPRQIGSCSTLVDYPSLADGEYAQNFNCPNGCLVSGFQSLSLQCSNGFYDLMGSCVNSDLPPPPPDGAWCNNNGTCDVWEDTFSCSNDCQYTHPTQPDGCPGFNILIGTCPISVNVPPSVGGQPINITCPSGCQPSPRETPTVTPYCTQGVISGMWKGGYCEPIDTGPRTCNLQNGVLYNGPTTGLPTGATQCVGSINFPSSSGDISVSCPTGCSGGPIKLRCDTGSGNYLERLGESAPCYRPNSTPPCTCDLTPGPGCTVTGCTCDPDCSQPDASPMQRLNPFQFTKRVNLFVGTPQYYYFDMPTNLSATLFTVDTVNLASSACDTISVTLTSPTGIIYDTIPAVQPVLVPNMESGRWLMKLERVGECNNTYDVNVWWQ